MAIFPIDVSLRKASGRFRGIRTGHAAAPKLSGSAEHAGSATLRFPRRHNTMMGFNSRRQDL